jgi:dolichyl-diphosphooligosaccharide--protein glycosyltransferase
MSSSTESTEDEGRSVLDILEDWYHVPALLVILVVMMAIRLQPYSNFVRDGEVFFSGNDAWYHLRMVNYTVRNWPSTMPFDPWTYFPYGTSVGQFGTLYDQLVATAALIVGLGSPSQRLVAETLLVAPVVFGALAVVPTYYIGKRLSNRLGGLFGAVVLMLLPGSFLQRSIAGVSDHNGIEPLFQALAVLGVLVALAVARRDKPVWELVVDRDVDGMRSTLFWGTVAGLALSLYMWVWPPGVLLVGVFGIFLVLKITSDVANGNSPESVAFVAAVSMGVTAVLMLVPLQTLAFSPTRFSLVQPFFALVVGGGAVFLAWLAREWDARGIDDSLYPVTVFGLVGVGFLFIAVALPSLYNTIETNILRIVGFSANVQTRTIGEAQPMLDPNLLARQGYTAIDRILTEYGFTFFTALLGTIWLLAKPLVRDGDSRRVGYAVGSVVLAGAILLLPGVWNGLAGALGADPQLLGLGLVTLLVIGAALLTEHRSEHLFVVIWAGFVTAMAFTQVRFNYYLAVVVAVTNAYVAGQLIAYLDLPTAIDRLDDVEGYQVIAVVAVVMLVLAPVLVVPLNVRDTGNPQFDRSSRAWEVSQNYGPGEVMEWEQSLEWMQSETPAEGTMGGAQNAMDYYGTYARDDGDFDYPDGAYGVMSWWDYGHWITVEGERIPNANPFQQGARDAANFLLAPNETQANGVLESQSTASEQTRYVMVDWKMALPGSSRSKFSAPIVFYDEANVSSEDFLRRVYTQDLSGSSLIHRQRYYESTMVRLYYYHGSAREAAPVVVDWEEGSAQTRSGETVSINYAPQNQSLVRANFENMSAARAYVEQDGSAQIGGIGPYPQERVSALEHYRLVKVSNSSALGSTAYRSSLLQTAQLTGVSPQFLRPSSPSWVKTFERVPGATIEGSGAPPNSNVTASVQMTIPTSNETFVYRQRAQTDADGEFTMVLPYSTTDYDQYGPENGYTNVSVRATGDYRITGPRTINESGYLVAYGTNVSVSEGLVSGAAEGSKEVTLERQATQTSLVRNETQNDSTGSANSSDLVPVEGSLSAADRTDAGSGAGDGSTAGGAESDPPATLAAAERFAPAVSVP